jgi:hypothetical protein
METSKFQTLISLLEHPEKTGYHKKNLFVGSCFTENIGNKLVGLKYPGLVNPFGILYNPASIANVLEILLQIKKTEEKDLVQFNGLWHSFHHHSKFSGIEKEKVLKTINNTILSSSAFLKDCDFLFLTFGTAWVYELKSSGKIVSNCHKIPEKKFRRYRLSVQEIVQRFNQIINWLYEINPNINLVFTVSPIRHWKDGAHGNQLSKSTLLLAVDQLVQLFDHVSYFPSYEIVMDELRDYRFYHEDMIHMNSTSVKYIWDRFTDTFMEKHTLDYMKKIQKIISAAHHRPFNPNTESHQNFIQSTFLNMEMLEKQLPNLSFGTERKLMRENLI